MKSISVSLAVTGGAGVNVIDVITVVTPFTFDRTPLATRSSDYRRVQGRVRVETLMCMY